jgi:phage terminase large subunit-like protein
MIDNVQIYRDTNDNIRAHKGKSRGKIDGVAATVIAIHEILEDVEPQTVDEIKFL